MINVLNIEDLGDLLKDVQTKNIFEDQKTFPDAIPKFNVKDILAEYQRVKYSVDFDLKTFVSANFDLPVIPDNRYKTKDTQNIESHIIELWNVLTRNDTHASGTLIPLPYPFVVPGGRFGEIYYWDSYFTMLGLQASGRMDLVQSMTDNFTYLINTIGFIPNGNRSYFLSRSQPPFYAYMIKLLQQKKGNIVLKQYLPALIKEHNYWMDGSELLSEENCAVKHAVRLGDGSILNRYWDSENKPRPEGFAIDLKIKETATENEELYRHIRAACESGWDFSGRWFEDGENISTICTANILPVDLNCLLLHLENTIAESYASLGDTDRKQLYTDKAESRKNAVNKYLWNSDKNVYSDYNFILKHPTSSIHLAMAFPLFIGIANKEQAENVLSFIRQNMLASYGLLTTTKETDQQWDAPRGWAPLQWIVYKSAMDYRDNLFAEKIRSRWCKHVENIFKTTGKLLEKYIVTDNQNKSGGGEYPNQDGFGWTNGVYMAMIKDNN